MSITQTTALFVDAYRELNARKMFWITLVLSGLVVLIFALVGINDRGLVLAFWTIEIDAFNTRVMPEATFYKSLFVGLGVGVWLTWVAAILALISTATIFPDLVSAGSIDLVLSKPISRLRLFITKYIFGLLFVTLQVSVFTVASFFVLGFRGGVWEPLIFLAIPIVVVFFSYLFGICATLGVMTRSTIAALLLTLLFWFLVFIIHGTESGVLSYKVMNEQRVNVLEQRVERYEGMLAQLRASQEEAEGENAEQIQNQIRRQQEQFDESSIELENARGSLSTVQTFHRIALGVKTVLPKTAETVGLLERYLIDLSELSGVQSQSGGSRTNMNGVQVDQQQLQQQAAEEIRERSVWWIVGTSLLFELVIVALGAWVFCRRDY